MIKLRLLKHIKGCANLLGGWRQGYDLRHGQAHLRTQVLMIDFQLLFPRLYLWFKTKIKLEYFNAYMWQIEYLIFRLDRWDFHFYRPSFGIHMHNPPVELDAMDGVVGDDCEVM